jgi:hypothetical protein
MESMKSADNNQDTRRQRVSLDGRYGKIGISAVAAAVRYQGEVAPRSPVPERGFDDND